MRLVFEADPLVAADVAAAERAVPMPQHLAHRDPAGMYTSQAPFWATLVAAQRLTATWSNRTVRVFLRVSFESVTDSDLSFWLLFSEWKTFWPLLPEEQFFQLDPATLLLHDWSCTS